MRIYYRRNLEDTELAVHKAQNGSVRIGRDSTCEVCLDNPRISSDHALLISDSHGWILENLSDDAVGVDNYVVMSGESARINNVGEIKLPSHPPLRLEWPDEKELSSAQRQLILEKQMTEFVIETHRELLKQLEQPGQEEQSTQWAQDESTLLQMERDIEEIARVKGFFDEDSKVLVAHFAANGVKSQLLENVISGAPASRSALGVKDRSWAAMYSRSVEMDRELVSIAKQFHARLQLDSINEITGQIAEIDNSFWSTWEVVSQQYREELIRYIGMMHLKKHIKDTVYGYGPLEDLLRLQNITEIMVVSADRIYVEKNGRLENSGRAFVSDEVIESIIQRIVSPVNRRIDKSQPLVDARLNDGSRVNAVISPIAVSGPALTIRKFPEQRLEMRHLVNFGAVTPPARDFLRAAVLARKNIIISGGTGTGKTTLLNCLSNFIPDHERIVTIEDVAELQLQKEHVVRMEKKEKNLEGKGEYSIQDLVRNSLRMRPDRIVVGECRGGEALDMLQAMNTGHDGSLTTIHANSSQDVILRLEVLVQEAKSLPVQSIHRQIASAVDIVVQLTREGGRRVSQITEFIAYDEREELIQTRDIFLLDDSQQHPVLCPTGSLPTFIAELLNEKLLSLDFFYV